MNFFIKVKNFLKTKITAYLNKKQKIKREKKLKTLFKGLENKDFSLISNNCLGGIVSHELNVRFNTQFVNLAIDVKGYIKYLQNLDYYNSLELEFVKKDWATYPVAKLGDIDEILFIHYKTEEEARQKWEERKKRLNKENLFIIMTEQDNCEYSDLVACDNLPYKNKIVFTCKKYDEIKSSFFVKRYKNKKQVFMFLAFKNLFTYKRESDCFNWVSWFNEQKDLKKLDLQK